MIAFRYLNKLEEHETHRGLRGISDDAFDDCADLNEYADVRRRFVEDPAVASSSSSGAARFFPFVSRTGSLIVRAAEVGAALRRALV